MYLQFFFVELKMYTIFNDRIFWIYLIITLSFIIIGFHYFLMNTIYYISIVWLLTMIFLMVVVYHISIMLAPVDTNSGIPVCVVDNNVDCLSKSNRLWVVINAVYFLLLILSVSWVYEFTNSFTHNTKPIFGIIIILLGIFLCKISYNIYQNKYTVTFWAAFLFTFFWFCMTLYFINS